MSHRLLLAGAVSHALILLATILLVVTTDRRSAFAASELLAVTGDPQPGSASIQLLGVSAATLNNSGEVVFRATLKPEVGPIDSTNDRAIWKIGATRTLIAQAGGGVPGGGGFDAFSAVSISDAGEVVLRATATGGQVGLWRYPPSPAAPTRIAVTGVTGVPDLPAGQWDALGFQLLHAPNGVTAINGRLAPGIGGVNSSNNFGVWIDNNSSQSLLIRSQLTNVPGVGGATFQIPTAVCVNNQAQIVSVGTLKIGVSGVTANNSVGIWRMGSGGGGALIARMNSGDVADPAGASYAALSEPSLNSSGNVAFAGELALGGDVTTANKHGVWLHDGVNGEAIVRSGSVAPGTAAGLFSSFAAPLLNDVNQMLVSAALAEGVGGVTSQNAQGLWVVESGGGTLLARTGSTGVPGVPGASFTSFGSLAFNELGVAAVQASLSNAAPGADQGLWLLDANGGGTLVVRTGDVVGSRTIASLEFAGGSGGGDGRQRALNASGQLVYKATFTNGDEGLFLYSPPVTSPADFTADGAVTADDLDKWRLGFGQSTGAGRSQGDADADGDVDGSDFLLWQRHLGAGVSLAAVPEPSLAAVLLPIALLGGLRFSRGAYPRASMKYRW